MNTAADRIAAADARLAEAKAKAQPPVAASPAIIAAPGRGSQVVVPQRDTVMTENGPRTRAITADGFHPVAAADAFDRMALASNRRRKEGDPPLFTNGQVGAGRDYAALSERCEAEGLRCSSVEGVGGGGLGGSWIDGVLQRSERLAGFHLAIGPGPALRPRGPSAHADRGRRVINVRTLVDDVCIRNRTLAEVLRHNGWASSSRYRTELRVMLCGALDRMYGL